MEKFINNLKLEYNANQNKIDKNLALIHEMNLLNFEDRLGRTTLLSTLFYLPSLFLLFMLNIPGAYYPLACLVGSFGIGITGNILMEKKAKCKERVKNVLKNKNKEKEILKLKMENEKLALHNEIINRVTSKYDKENKMIKKFSSGGRYNISINKSNYTNEELIAKINELETELKNKYEYLDSLSDSSVLKEQKKLSDYKMNDFFYSMIASCVPLMLSIMPIFTYTIRPLSEPSFIPMISTLGVSAATFAGGLTYFKSKRIKQNKAINSLKKDNTNVKDENLLNEINRVKSSISNLLYSIQNYKQELEMNELVQNCDKKTVKKIYDYEEDYSLEKGPKLTLK